MKKFSALLAVLICAFLLFGCGQSVDVAFLDMNSVLSRVDGPSYEYERCVYSVEISDGKTGGEKTVYTDPAFSEMSLTFRKQADATALIEMQMTVKFLSTPPYAVKNKDGSYKTEYAGLTDTITSAVVFNGYSQVFNPLKVEKTVTLETDADKSFSAAFEYPKGKERGTGKYVDSADKQTDFSIKAKSLKNAFDNEQIYYMVSAFLFGTKNSNGESALGYSKQYKVFNLADRCVYGKGAASLSFSVGADKLGDYENIATYAEGSAEVTISFSQGQPLIMRYSLGNSISIGGAALRPRKNLLLGYKQEIRDSLSSVAAVTSFTLKDYSTTEI